MSKPRKKGGRPKKSPGEVASYQLQVRLLAEEKELLRARAKAEGVTMSELVRSIVSRGLEKAAKEIQDTPSAKRGVKNPAGEHQE